MSKPRAFSRLITGCALLVVVLLVGCATNHNWPKHGRATRQAVPLALGLKLPFGQHLSSQQETTDMQAMLTIISVLPSHPSEMAIVKPIDFTWLRKNRWPTQHGMARTYDF